LLNKFLPRGGEIPPQFLIKRIIIMKRYIKSYTSRSRKVAWSNAKKYNITIGTHIYQGSMGGVDYFIDRLTKKETAITNNTFNNSWSL
jgi:hypothetical protein|tara:strand:+ start:259 stop:522 length:264 start_codon:yes stop_codon:yes gene_type:complete